MRCTRRLQYCCRALQRTRHVRHAPEYTKRCSCVIRLDQQPASTCRSRSGFPIPSNGLANRGLDKVQNSNRLCSGPLLPRSVGRSTELLVKDRLAVTVPSQPHLPHANAPPIPGFVFPPLALRSAVSKRVRIARANATRCAVSIRPESSVGGYQRDISRAFPADNNDFLVFDNSYPRRLLDSRGGCCR